LIIVEQILQIFQNFQIKLSLFVSIKCFYHNESSF
jgi:hypothetical protein